MSLPCPGDGVNYYWQASAPPIPGVVENVDDIRGLLMVRYIPPSAEQDVIISPWSSQGTGLGQWELPS